MSYPVELFSNVDDKDEFKRELDLIRETRALKALTEAINTKIEGLIAQEYDYATPNWAYQQSHINGMRQAYTYIRKLMTNGE